MSLLIVLWIVSMVPLLILPYGIAVFYQRIFKRRTYPYVFLIALILYIVSGAYPYILWGNLFFALGGILLGGASIRLNHVMTKRWK